MLAAPTDDSGCPAHHRRQPAQVLRLEPHVVISNRTPVPLQLLQSRLTLVTPQVAKPSVRGLAQQRPSGAVVAEGGSSFSAASSRGLSASPLWAGGAPPGAGEGCVGGRPHTCTPC